MLHKTKTESTELWTAGRNTSANNPRVASIVEIVLFIVLLTRGLYAVVQAAVLGSILATMLLCLGMCFFIGGIRRDEQEFSETVSEAGNGLLLTA